MSDKFIIFNSPILISYSTTVKKVLNLNKYNLKIFDKFSLA